MECARMETRPSTRRCAMKSASAGKIRVSAVENRSVGGIAAMVIEQSATMPIGAPVAPPPAKPGKKPDAYAQAERVTRSVKIESRVWIPIRIDADRGPIDDPRIVFWPVNNFAVRRLNDDSPSLGGHGLL